MPKRGRVEDEGTPSATGECKLSSLPLSSILAYLDERLVFNFRLVAKLWKQTVGTMAADQFRRNLVLGVWRPVATPRKVCRQLWCCLRDASTTFFPHLIGIDFSRWEHVDSILVQLVLQEVNERRGRLRALDVANEYLRLPASSVERICGISSLVSLSVGTSLPDLAQFSLLTHLGKLSSLTALKLSECWRLSEEGVAALCDLLPSLQVLDLSFCDGVTDGCVKMIAEHLRGLKSLSLEWCQRVGDPGAEELRKLHHLTSLNLSGCCLFTDATVASICSSCQQLQILCLAQSGPPLRKNGFTDVSLRCIAESLQSITILDLSSCGRVTDDGVAAVGGLSTLTVLNLSHCTRLTDLGVRRIARLRGLQSLSLSGCVRVTSASLRKIKRNHPKLAELTFFSSLRAHAYNLAAMRRLRTLDLNWAKATDRALVACARLPQLQRLCLSHCKRITDTGVLQLEALCASLQSLDLSHCFRITDRTLDFLERCKMALHTLFLDHCVEISDAGVKSLLGIPSLRRLGLLGCPKVTETGIESLLAHPNLRRAGLSLGTISEPLLVRVRQFNTVPVLDYFPRLQQEALLKAETFPF
jgi:hypothetical protein